MALNAIFNNAQSGLSAAQKGLHAVSQNVTNVNTPGYARAIADQSASSAPGGPGGVEVETLRRAADQFLTAATLTSAADKGQAGARADLLDRAQAALGDPNQKGVLFNALDEMFTAFTALAREPANTLLRSGALAAVQDLLNRLSAAGAELTALRQEADERLVAETKEASALLVKIADLNDQITRTAATGGDVTSAENAQAQAIDALSNYLDIKTSKRAIAGVEVRTAAGALLVGDTAATLSYTLPATPDTPSEGVQLIDRNGGTLSLRGQIRGGSIQGLAQTRDGDLRELSEALGALAGAGADALNAAHSQSTAIPARTRLEGRQTGLLDADRVGFTGSAVVAITGADGALARRVELDFDAGTYSVDGAAAVSFGGANASVASFAAGLDAALDGVGDASFADGVLTLSGQGGNGVVLQQDGGDPSDRGGRGFAHFFGLNDLITRDQPIFFETGLDADEAHGLAAGGAIGLRVRDGDGRTVLERDVNVTGSTWQDMIDALNASGSGLSGYASFALDSQGRLAASSAGYTVEIASDTTARGGTGLSMSGLFGLDFNAAGGRAREIGLNRAIAANPALLGLARPDLSLAVGERVLEAGDNRGGEALAAARDRSSNFPAAGALVAQSTTLSAYAARLGGEAGRRAAEADRAKTSAESLYKAAADRRAGGEGVSLDDELVKMTQYQQSYAAASRLILAGQEMFDTLLGLT